VLNTKARQFNNMIEVLICATFISIDDIGLRVVAYDMESDVCILLNEDTGDEHEIENASTVISAQQVSVLTTVDID